MHICECGCGQVVMSMRAKFARGHHPNSGTRRGKRFVAESVAQRLGRLTARTPGCWFWTGPTHGKRGGYGVFSHPDIPQTYAHRVAWAAANGREIPAGISVLHRCDNRLCVRPDHLFLGTQADNMADMYRKGRPNGRQKLSAQQVREIRARYVPRKVSIPKLASEYGVSIQGVWRIVRGLAWKRCLPS